MNKVCGCLTEQLGAGFAVPVPPDPGGRCPAGILPHNPAFWKEVFHLIQLNDPALLRSLIQRYNLQEKFSMNLEEQAFIVTFNPGEIICHAGDVENTLMILVEGECIAYTINKTGKMHCELHYSGLHFLGLVSSIWGKPAINDIKALTHCKFLIVPCVDKLHQDVRFLNFAVLYLADHIRKNSRHFERLPTRLANFILETQHDGVFSYNMALCADILETSPRHLQRTLREFCDQGILRHETKGVYTILDMDRLSE